MHWLLLLSILPLVSARNIRDFRRQEEEPFDVNTDLFSHLLSLVPPDSNDIEDLKVTTSRRFTGPTSPGLVTAKPPGYSPMPPGFNDERERELVWKGSHQPDISQPKSENFQMAEIDANRDDSNDKVEEEEPHEKRVERLFIKEVTDASKALELFTTTVSYDQDEVVLALEGSGLFEEAKKLEDKKENATSREGSGKAFEDSKEEIAFLVGLPKTKVSGEVGMEEDFARKWKRRKTISVDTFLLNSAPFLGIEERLRSAENSNNTEPLRGAVEGCPVPELCAVNCFVTIDSHGCQICQCLWQALACEKDSDCPEASQHCDLGKCDCADGFLQDMTRSGMCKVADATALGAGGLPFKGQEEESSTRIKKGKKARKHLRRMRRAAQFGEKPRSAERLQWPGED